MALSRIHKLTGWLTLLLVLLHVQVLPVRSRLNVDQDTQAYITALYTSPFILNLINDYPQQYLRVVFRHFRADFVQNDIGNWDNSHWPILLQDLDLMPGQYRTRTANEYAGPLRVFWLQEKDRLEAQPIANYGHMVVRVPDAMADVFHQDAARYRFDLIAYDYLVDEMQHFADQYEVRSHSRKVNLMRCHGKRLRFLAMYWLTVLDQFIGEVRGVAGAGAILASPSPRTRLMPLDPQQAPGRRVGPVAAQVVGRYPQPLQAPGQRALPPAYPHNPGPRGPPPAYPHHSGPRAPPPPYPLNPGPRAPPPAYPHQVGPRVGPMAQPMAQPGPSGSNPGKRAPSPNRGTKRKATHQGGGPFQGGGKRGPGGAMRSMDGASNESQVGPQAQQSNFGGSSTALPFVTVIMVIIAVSLISFG